MQPGIHTIDISDYHGGEGVSKSGLHTILTKTPYSYRFGDRKETDSQRFGNAAHTAVLEPLLFELRYMRGPDDRRGNKWGAAQEMAAAVGKTCLTSGDYDDAMRLRDVLHRDERLRRLTAGAPAIEQSAYAIDAETGELVRVRPDLYSHDMKVMVDLKSSASLDTEKMSKNFAAFGYQMQESMYRDVWEQAYQQSGLSAGHPSSPGQVDAFLFLVVERDAPHAYRWIELQPSAAEEGHAMYRHALGVYHECMEAERAVTAQYKTDSPDRDALLTKCWPMYGEQVEELSLPAWSYKFTRRDEE